MMKKTVRVTTSFQKILKKLTKQWIYTESKFITAIRLYLEDETNPSFRKHKIKTSQSDEVRSISLWYDLRTLYYKEIIVSNEEVAYIFFDIGTHDDIY